MGKIYPIRNNCLLNYSWHLNNGRVRNTHPPCNWKSPYNFTVSPSCPQFSICRVNCGSCNEKNYLAKSLCISGPLSSNPCCSRINQILNSDNSEKTKLFLLTHISKLNLFAKHLLKLCEFGFLKRFQSEVQKEQFLAHLKC